MRTPLVYRHLIVYYTPVRRQKTVRNTPGVGQKLQIVPAPTHAPLIYAKQKLPIPAGMGSLIIRMQAEGLACGRVRNLNRRGQRSLVSADSFGFLSRLCFAAYSCFRYAAMASSPQAG